MTRFVVERPTQYLWRIFDARKFQYEYVLFDVFRPDCARMWVDGETVEEDPEWARAEVELLLADAMLRRKMTPPRVVGHLPPVSMEW